MKDFGRLRYSAEEERRKKRRGPEKLTILGWIMLILTGGGLCVLLITNLFGFYSSQIIVTSYQSLTRSFTAEGLLIRDETVTFAPGRGKVEIKVEEGEKVSAGKNIVTLKIGRKKEELYNYEAGVVSYKIDGLEETLQTKKRKKLSYQQFKEMSGQISSVQSGERVNIGRPLFKIIDNFTFYLAVLLPQDKLAEYEVGDNVEIEFTTLKGVRPFKGKIDDIIADKPDNIMIIKLTKFISKLIGIRKTEVKVIKNKYHGIVLPKSALIENDQGEIGVKVRGQVQDHFKKVEVKHKVGDQVIVRGILPGVKVLLN